MYRLKIQHDQDPINPREEWDNADVMFCRHGRYTLGDADADDPVEHVDVFRPRDTGGQVYELESAIDDNGYYRDNAPALNYESVLGMLKEHAASAWEAYAAMRKPGVPSSDAEREQARAGCERADAGLTYVDGLRSENEYRVRPGIAIIRPLHLYDHSGITISAGAFSCAWDSGQVGWQYVTEDALAREWSGDREAALRYMDAALQTYDDYLTGNTYGYVAEQGVLGTTTYADGSTEPTIRWEFEGSCWGFFGDWWGEGDPAGMRANLSPELQPLFDSLNYNDTETWHYTADVPRELHDEL